MFTKMQVAKEAATITLSVVFSKGLASIITSTTDLDEDGYTVQITSILGGWMMANALRDQTDAGVEWAASKLTEIRENRKTKKDKPQTETP